MHDKISMTYTREIPKYVLTSAYEFHPTSKFTFLQKWFWNWLIKLGALKQYWNEKISYVRIDIDQNDFANRLWEAYSKCFPYNTKPKQVFLGPDEFQELISQQYDNKLPFTFDITMGYSGTLFNLPVTVIPHMKGVLIV